MHIRKVEIKNLWGNDFSWTLNEDVNVLIGRNGLGKSTILRMLHQAVLPTEHKLDLELFYSIDEMIVEMEDDIVIRINSEARTITTNKKSIDYKSNVTLINTFDVHEDIPNHIAPILSHDFTYLDSLLLTLKHEFTGYQRDLAIKAEEAFRIDDGNLRQSKIQEMEATYEPKNLFSKILSEVFSETQKQFDEKNFEFLKEGIQLPIKPEKLSSGEKQILIILVSTLLQNRKKHILLMDEPEISLHIGWQQNLIKNIRRINPNCQIIVTTHSANIYLQGWVEKVTWLADIKSISSSDRESDILTETNIESNNLIQEIILDFTDFSGNENVKRYNFNRKLNSYTSFTKNECIELLDFLRQNEITPDVITFTSLISKVSNYEDAKEIFDLMEQEKYTKLSYVKPNDITINTLIKKVSKVEDGIELIQNLSANEKLQVYPDIITFSTLLGKARNIKEIELIEELREYYGVDKNNIYSSKLKFKGFQGGN